MGAPQQSSGGASPAGLTFGSVCSGIEAASEAWEPLGWRPAFYAEIEPFPCYVLAQRWGASRPAFMPDPDEPDPPAPAAPITKDERDARRNAIKVVQELPAAARVPNLGDMTKWKEWPDAAIDVLVGGTPCQSYSVAGLREGMDDPRGQLTLSYAAVARKYRPRWVVWENVPGVLSSDGGRDFAGFLGLLTGRRITVPAAGGWQSAGVIPGIDIAYGVAWRVLDAQFAGVPQRRRRVFLVGRIGDWRGAAAVLFERASLRGDSPPRRAARKGTTGAAEGGAAGGGDVAGTITGGHDTGRNHGKRSGSDRHLVGGETTWWDGKDVADTLDTSRIAKQQTMPDKGRFAAVITSEVAPTLCGAGNRTGGDRPPGTQVETAESLIAFSCKDHGGDATVEQSPTLRALEHKDGNANGGGQVAIATLAEPIPFDTTQITSPANYSAPKPGDPAPPLAEGAHPTAIAFQERGREGGRNLEHSDGVAYAVTSPAGGGRRQEMNVASFQSATEFLPQSARVYSENEVAPALQSTGDNDGHRAPNVAVGVDLENYATTGDLSGTIRAEAQARGNTGAAVLAVDLQNVALGGDVAGTLDTSVMAEAQVFEARYARNGRGAPDDVAPPLKAQSGESGKGDAAPLVFQPRNFTRDNKTGGADSTSSDTAPPITAGHANGDSAPHIALEATAFSVYPEGGQGADLRATEIDVAPAVTSNASSAYSGERGARVVQPVSGTISAEHARNRGLGQENEGDLVAQDRAPGESHAARVLMHVRRLTPRECERLQGFRDDFTLVMYRGKLAADGPRYRALGNSMAVPCMQWLGLRIQFVEGIVLSRTVVAWVGA